MSIQMAREQQKAPTKRYKADRVTKQPSRQVGAFGVCPLQDSDGTNHLLVAWVVTDARQDKRTGASSNIPMSAYSKELLDACFKDWR